MTLSNRAVSHLQDLMHDGDNVAERYVLGELIGRGGMGVVYRAYDELLQREVAIKLLNVPNVLAKDVRARMHQEASILAKLEHPGIVPVHDIGVFADGRTYCVMRFVRGQRLDEHVAAGISRGDALRIMLRLCETVAFANSRGVVHRDLKPANVMIGPFGEVLVLDWGVAKVVNAEGADDLPSVQPETAHRDTEATADGAIIGTPGYMSPEQRDGSSGAVQQTADVYALGAMLHELLQQTTEVQGLGSFPRALEAVVARAMAARPQDRYPSALEFADDIRRWMDGQAVTAYRERAFERAQRFYRQHQTAVLLVATYLVVRTVILFWRKI